MRDFASLSARELLTISAGAHEELLSRGVIRTSNATGCYAEHLFSKAFGWKLNTNSHPGVDAVHAGIRFQIKSRRVTRRNPSRQLGDFSALETKPFDVLAAVLFNDDFTVMRAALVPYAVAFSECTLVKGKHRLILRERVWEQDQVRDVTKELRLAQ